MPRFALLDAENRVVNVVALARKEDFLQVVTHGEGEAADPVWADTDHHLVAHGAVEVVEAPLSTRVGMVRVDGAFVWPPQPDPAPALAPTTDASAQ